MTIVLALYLCFIGLITLHFYNDYIMRYIMIASHHIAKNSHFYG
ncbi:hypothetical protein [Helicobacter sp. MIT 01-3238]|nr:hypothetical protein [Helicobacter sp. MIT 01-3238]